MQPIATSDRVYLPRTSSWSTSARTTTDSASVEKQSALKTKGEGTRGQRASRRKALEQLLCMCFVETEFFHVAQLTRFDVREQESSLNLFVYFFIWIISLDLQVGRWILSGSRIINENILYVSIWIIAYDEPAKNVSWIYNWALLFWHQSDLPKRSIVLFVIIVYYNINTILIIFFLTYSVDACCIVNKICHLIFCNIKT